LERFSTKTQFLQRIDGIAGAAACFFLTLVRKIADAVSPPLKGPANTVLFVKLAEQGSTVLAYDTISRAVKRFGRENVYFLVFEENRFILDLLGLVPPENVFTIRTKSLVTMITSCLEKLAEIRAKKIDACIDMEFFARSTAAIAYLSGARDRVGFHCYFGEGPYRGDLLTHRVLYNPHIHASSTFSSLVMALDVAPDKFPTFDAIPPLSGAPQIFKGTPEEIRDMEQLLQSLRPPGTSRLILLNSNASDMLPLRKWDEKNYIELAKRLLAAFPELCIGFTGAPNEAEKIGGIVTKIGSPRAFCLAGRTTLRHLLVVYGMAEVLVTNDSGPAHFATLTSVDVVTLFGPETPKLFGAPSPRNHNIWAGIACSPCVNAWNNRQSACKDNVCMQRISIDEVFDMTCKVYRKRTSQAAVAV